MPRPRSDIRPRLVAAALEEFLDKGVDGASLRSIARAAGTNIGMVYYYFPAKDDLFLGVVESAYAGLLERLEKALTPGEFPTQVRRLYDFISELSDQERSVIRLLVREALSSTARLSKLIARFEAGHIPLLVQMSVRGIQSGHVHPSHHPLIVVACLLGIGALPQFALPVLSSRLPAGATPPPMKLPAELAEIFLCGLSAPAPAAGGDDETP